MAKKGSKAKTRVYDEDRKTETLQKLKTGMAQLRRQKEHQDGKAITAYKLSKQTGVDRKTIVKFPEILDLLTKEKFPGVPLKSAVVKIEKIYTLEQAVGIITSVTDLYNETKDKYNEAMKKNSALHLQIVKLQSEVAELNRVIQVRDRK